MCAQARGNLDKILGGLRATGCQGSSLLALLRSEAAAGMHGAGGVLADPSAAMGVLWISRFVSFWEQICLMRLQPPPPNGCTPTLTQTISDAYQQQLLPVAKRRIIMICATLRALLRRNLRCHPCTTLMILEKLSDSEFDS